MGSRLEWGLLFTILAILQLDYSNNLAQSKTEQHKEIEKIASATDIKLYETNKTSLVTLIEAKNLISYTNQNYYSNINIKSHKFTIKSDDAREINNIIDITNTTIIDIDRNSTYTSTKLKYDKSTGSLKLIGNFTLEDSRGSIKGDNLIYNSSNNNIEGSNINAYYEIH